jgi:hypothetical protein
VGQGLTLSHAVSQSSVNRFVARLGPGPVAARHGEIAQAPCVEVLGQRRLRLKGAVIKDNSRIVNALISVSYEEIKEEVNNK